MLKKNKREFKTGANRNSDHGKLDYEGFNSVLVDWMYAQYMHKHRLLEDGTYRDSDNWQKGFPKDVIAKSLVRHVMDFRLQHRGYRVVENGKPHSQEEILCGIIFNAKAYLHEILKEKMQDKDIDRSFSTGLFD